MTRSKKVFPITGQTVIDFLERIAPPDSGIPNDDNRLLYGDPHQAVSTVAVTWMPTRPALRAALKMGAQLLLVHERLFMPAQTKSPWFQDTESADKPINQDIHRLLEGTGLSVYRLHSNWDAYVGEGVLDAIASTLGLRVLHQGDRFVRTYRIKSCTLADFARRTGQRLKIPGLRYWGLPEAKISRVTPLIGGFGVSQRNMVELIARQEGQVIVAGDLMESTLLYAQELGIFVVEAGHSMSERPGMWGMQKVVQAQFPGLQVNHLDSGAWFMPDSPVQWINLR